MTDREFRDWLDDEVAHGRMTPVQRKDLLDQKTNFDHDRETLQRQYQQQVVGYANGQREVGDTVHEVLRQAQVHNPGRMVYFEPIGFDLY